MRNIKHKTKPTQVDWHEHITFTFRDAKTGKVTRRFTEKNLVVDAGLELMLEALSGGLAAISDIEINEVMLGTDGTAVTAGDTVLGTETFRKAIASLTFSGTTMFATAFWTASEAVGTHSEAGVAINGTGATDSGTLWSRVVLSPSIVKSASETLTVDYEWTATAT